MDIKITFPQWRFEMIYLGSNSHKVNKSLLTQLKCRVGCKSLEDALAVYNINKDIIYISPSLLKEGENFREILFHELVHKAIHEIFSSMDFQFVWDWITSKSQISKKFYKKFYEKEISEEDIRDFLQVSYRVAKRTLSYLPDWVREEFKLFFIKEIEKGVSEEILQQNKKIISLLRG